MLLVVLLGGCAGPADGGSNPIEDFEKVIDLIPWAKSIAADATAEQVTARIAEITAGLPSLDITDAERSAIETKLTALSDAVAANPSDTAAHAAELNAIVDEVKAAVQ
ncbi:hypothetical protein [Microbacterium sp. cf046]|uniref:hypothetical protein n=1 Tax=Microbacterium sp. cf046 TaxID=1761803 RepID=UPI000B83EE59|nr:hypothetical protein [Microbacterium sp. cf046]